MVEPRNVGHINQDFVGMFLMLCFGSESSLQTVRLEPFVLN